jgi:hypothetical protein
MEPELIRLYQQSIDVILNGLRDTLPPEDKHEEKILEEVDKWKMERK